MMEGLMPWLITAGAGALISMGCAAFAKFMPKAKLLGYIKPPCVTLGKVISKFLNAKVGEKNAEKIEEGLFVTLLTVLGQAPLYIVEGMVSDNSKPKKEKKKK